MAKYGYDVTIIGGGSGGLTAARLAAALGARTALIDKERLGGDCLHYGCVPSKALIHVAKIVHLARSSLDLGLLPANVPAKVPANVQIDMARVSAHVQQVIGRVAEGEKVYVEGINVRLGRATFRSNHELDLNGEQILSKNVLIATGSRPRVPPIDGVKEVRYLTNEDLFDLQKMPASLAVVGGGPVGVEMAQAFARLGSQVTLLQGPARILPKEEPEVSETIAHVLMREGIKVETGAPVQRLSSQGNKKVVEARQGEQMLRIEADEVLLALGRAPNVEGLNLEAAGVAYNQNGIQTNAYLQTTAANISAIGDVIGGHLFTHVAAYQAGVAVRNMLVPVGRKKVDYRALPWVTFTDPEAARVGLTEEEAMQQGRRFRVVHFPWHALDRAQTDGSLGALDGFIKLIVAEKDDTILGAHLVGSRAGELLGELTLAMQHHLGFQAILATIHAYPTLSTGIQQTAFEAYLKSAALNSARRIIRPLLAWRG